MSSLARPPHRRARRFMLTPLVDVIFLLLSFFMLSSRIAPYSLTPFGAATESAAKQNRATAPSSDLADLLVVVERGRAELNGHAVAMSGLVDALDALRTGGARSAIVMTRASATVQDFVSTIEAIRRAAFESVVIQRRSTHDERR